MRWPVLVFALLFLRPVGAAELSQLRVLYVGNAQSSRAADFKAFLSTNVAKVDVASRDGFDPATAKDFDVVLLDWSQGESQGNFPPKKSPLGRRENWHTPIVLLGSAGLHMSIVWEVKGGFG